MERHHPETQPEERRTPLEPSQPPARPMPFMGVPLFVDERDKASLKRASRAAYDFFGRPSIDRRAAKRYRITLLGIVRGYWARKDYECQSSSADIKGYLTVFRKKIDEAAIAMDKLPLAAKRAVRTSRVILMNNEEVDVFNETQKMLKLLLQASDRLIEPKFTRGDVAVAIPHCCTAIEDLWNEVTNKRVYRTKGLTAAARGARELPSDGARFVYAILKAIDDTVTIKNVHSWLATTKASKAEEKIDPKISR